ncbi:MAG: serine/threonine protein kinase [Planctomycetes bacterium]|nr:serine/threonine protein kinase [Planctomycetota bacterium]
MPDHAAAQETRDAGGDGPAKTVILSHAPAEALGEFELLEELGRGGMGVVYRARQRSLGREVALKVLSPACSADPEASARFLREARAAAAISHPNVITCYAAGEDGGRLYLAMELMRGGDAQRLAEQAGGRLPERRALEVIRDAARGLGALERAGLLHRDIKPANIFVTEDGVAKLADLGLARTRAGDDRMTHAGTIMGTPAFMSPEQAEAADDLDIRSDVYALGASLFTLVTGRAPFDGRSALAVMSKVLQEPPPDPRALAPGLSDAAAALILRAMAKERERRFPGAAALLEALEAALAAPTAPRPAPARGWQVAAGALGVVAAVSVALSLVGGRAPEAGASAPPVAAGPSATAPAEAPPVPPEPAPVAAGDAEPPSPDDDVQGPLRPRAAPPSSWSVRDGWLALAPADAGGRVSLLDAEAAPRRLPLRVVWRLRGVHVSREGSPGLVYHLGLRARNDEVEGAAALRGAVWLTLSVERDRARGLLLCADHRRRPGDEVPPRGGPPPDGLDRLHEFVVAPFGPDDALELELALTRSTWRFELRRPGEGPQGRSGRFDQSRTTSMASALSPGVFLWGEVAAAGGGGGRGELSCELLPPPPEPAEPARPAEPRPPTAGDVIDRLRRVGR